MKHLSRMRNVEVGQFHKHVKCPQIFFLSTQQFSYSISHLLGTVTTHDWTVML